MVQAIAALRVKASGLPASKADDYGVIVGGAPKLVRLPAKPPYELQTFAGKTGKLCWRKNVGHCRGWGAHESTELKHHMLRTHDIMPALPLPRMACTGCERS